VAADVELIAELPTSPVPLVGDASRLTQVLTNLLENARKFTPGGGWVRVTLVADVTAREAVLTVTDSGAGIDPALLGALFEPFRHAEHVGQPGAGLGLGLAIVHRLVELYGGRISAYSAGRNRGTTITVRLPMAWEPGARS
jgi:signal transduction histidine kinase